MRSLSPGLMTCRKCGGWSFYTTLKEGDAFVRKHRHGLPWASVMVIPRYQEATKGAA